MIKRILYNNKIMLTICLIAVLSLTVITGMSLVRADRRVEYNKTFISIEIGSGDTLTSIAKEYAISESDYADYIDEVKQINNLKNDTIHAGCYLMIPVYQPVLPEK